MDRETVISLAEKAGLFIQEGVQDRLLYDAPIVDALAKFADLAKGTETTVRVFLDDEQFVELRLPDGLASPVIEAIKDAFKKGQDSAKVSMAKMLMPSP